MQKYKRYAGEWIGLVLKMSIAIFMLIAILEKLGL